MSSKSNVNSIRDLKDLLSETTIVLTSDEPWSAIWHTQLHYAWQLSKYATVLYLGPPRAWSFKNLLAGWRKPQKVNENLFVFEYFNALPATLGIISMFINDTLNEIRLNYFIKKSNKLPTGLVWKFDHFRGYFLFRKNPKIKKIYHLVDPATTDRYDSLFASRSDLVVVTSPKFFKHYQQLNKNTIQIPQGVDLNFYSHQTHLNNPDNYFKAVDSILLLGTLTYDVDYRLLFKIAQAYPKKLLIIGPDKIDGAEAKKDWITLRDSGLVNWMGPMSPEQFLPYLQLCKIGIITYVSESTIDNNLRSPLKVINYLAAGKCVISNIDCEIPSLIGKAIYTANDVTDFLNYLEQAYNSTLFPDKPSVDSFLNSISYDLLIKSILSRGIISNQTQNDNPPGEM